MTIIRVVASLAAATLVGSCSSSTSSTEAGQSGSASPAAAALRYASALENHDLKDLNAGIARNRTDCPARRGNHLQAVAIPNRGEHLHIRVDRAGHTWRVTLFTTELDASSWSEPPLVVVRDAGRYFVC